MKWTDCMNAYNKTYVEIHGCPRRFTRLGNRIKSDVWIELYYTYIPDGTIERSAQMTLEMIKLHLIEHDDVKNLRIIMEEKARNRHIRLIDYLARICNLELNVGEDLLDIATYYRSYKIITWLLSLKVDPFMYNSQGISAISRAFETGNTHLINKYISLKTRETLTMVEIFGLLCIKNRKIMKILGISRSSEVIYQIYKSKLQNGLHPEPSH